MKKTSLITFILVLIITSGYSQHRWGLSFNYGAAVPAGDFGSKDFNNPKAIYAKIGTSKSFTVQYKIHNRFHILLVGTWQRNTSDNKQLSADYYTPAYQYLAVDVKPWITKQLMTGMSYEWPVGRAKKIFLTAQLLLGGINITIPERRIRTVAVSGNTTLVAEMKQAKEKMGWSFASMQGFGAKAFIYKSLFLKANLDYVFAQPTFEYTSTLETTRFGMPTEMTPTTAPPTAPTSSKKYYTQPFQSFLASAGVGIVF